MACRTAVPFARALWIRANSGWLLWPGSSGVANAHELDTSCDAEANVWRQVETSSSVTIAQLSAKGAGSLRAAMQGYGSACGWYGWYGTERMPSRRIGSSWPLPGLTMLPNSCHSTSAGTVHAGARAAISPPSASARSTPIVQAPAPCASSVPFITLHAVRAANETKTLQGLTHVQRASDAQPYKRTLARALRASSNSHCARIQTALHSCRLSWRPTAGSGLMAPGSQLTAHSWPAALALATLNSCAAASSGSGTCGHSTQEHKAGCQLSQCWRCAHRRVVVQAARWPSSSAGLCADAHSTLAVPRRH